MVIQTLHFPTRISQQRSNTLRCNAVLATDFTKGLLEAQVFKGNVQVTQTHTIENSSWTFNRDLSSVKTNAKHLILLSSSFHSSIFLILFLFHFYFPSSPLATNAYYFLQRISISLWCAPLKLVQDMYVQVSTSLTCHADSAQLLWGGFCDSCLEGIQGCDRGLRSAARWSYKWMFQQRAQMCLRKFQWNSQSIYQGNSGFYHIIGERIISNVSLVVYLPSGHFRDITIPGKCFVDSKSLPSLVLAGTPSGSLQEIFLTACL